PLIERIPESIRASRITRVIGAVATFQLVCIGWVLFRARSVAAAGSMLREMLLPTSLVVNFSSDAITYVFIGFVCLATGLLVSGRGIAGRRPAWTRRAAAAG